MSERNDSALVGRVLGGKFRLDVCLGSGAGGAVYRAHHETLDKAVALKVLHRAHAADPQLVERFRGEARAAFRLDHPHSVRILDFGEDAQDQLLYIAMEFLEGEDLQTLIQREAQFSSVRIAHLMTQVSAALAMAHSQGIVHRDMKPGNIMILPHPLEDGGVTEWVKVCDFGLAKIFDAGPREDSHSGSGPLTQEGAVFGTPSYMAPEQAEGKPVDGRADQYACGMIMFRMAAGRHPFSSETAAGMLMKQILEEPPPIADWVPDIDPRLAELIDRALQKDPDDRYPSMKDMLAPLREIAGGVVVGSVSAAFRPSTAVFSEVEAIAAPLAGDVEIVERSGVPSVSVDELEAGGMLDTLPSSGSGSLKSPTYPPETSQAPGITRSALVVMLIGSFSLLLVGAIGAYLYFESTTKRPGRADAPPAAPPPAMVAAPDAPREVAPVPGNRVQDGGLSLDLQDETSSEASADAQASAAMQPAPVSPRPRGRRAGRRRARRKARARSSKEARASNPGDADEVSKSAAVAPPPPEPPPAPPPVEPPPPPPVEPPPPPPPPAGPKRLGADFKMTVTFDRVDIDGGLSVKSTTSRLRRVIGDLRRCLMTEVRKAGVETSGRLVVKARVVSRGRLRRIDAQGPLPGAHGCVEDTLGKVRVDAPDTGEPQLTIRLGYRASAKS